MCCVGVVRRRDGGEQRERERARERERERERVKHNPSLQGFLQPGKKLELKFEMYVAGYKNGKIVLHVLKP